MSARSPYLVSALKLIEAQYVVYAENIDDAREQAYRNSDIARVVDIRWLADNEDESKYEEM